MLAVVAGAVHEVLASRALAVRDVDFRVAVPVSVRTESELGELGNRVASVIARLPVDEPDPRRRLERVIATMRELKRSGETQTVELLGRLADWLPLGLMAGCRAPAPVASA